MFRIGKFQQDKVCPIIVKLHSQCDKRLILSKQSSLKTSMYKDILIVPDQPLDVRRKICLYRLKHKAIIEGRHVAVVNDVLVIDGARGVLFGRRLKEF